MKILMVEPTGHNSHFHYVRALFDRLTATGCDIRVLTSSTFNHPGYLNRLYCMGESPRFHWPLLGGILRKIDRLIKISTNYFRIVNTIRTMNIQIVHFQVLHFLFLPLVWLAKKKLHFQIVYTPHNIEAHYRKKWFLNNLNALFFKCCGRAIDAFVAHTPYHANKLEAKGVGQDKITIIPYAPHMVRDKDPSLRQPRTILFAGSIRRNKGILQFLEALGKLDRLLGQDRQDPVTVIIAGQSRDILITDTIDALAQERGNLTIEFHNNFIPPDEYSIFFNRARILVLPYTREFQSLSAVLLDGYHYDNEIIVTDAGANGETVKADNTGVVVATGDVEALAEEIHQLLRREPDPIHSQNRARALRDIYNWDIIASQTLAFYEQRLVSASDKKQ